MTKYLNQIVEKNIFQKIRKNIFLWILFLVSWINVSATKSLSWWTKSIDPDEISPKTCSDFFSDAYRPPKFRFNKLFIFAAVFIFEMFFPFFHQMYYVCMICLGKNFITWNNIFRGSRVSLTMPFRVDHGREILLALAQMMHLCLQEQAPINPWPGDEHIPNKICVHR